jgi:hypothetical protein
MGKNEEKRKQEEVISTEAEEWCLLGCYAVWIF